VNDTSPEMDKMIAERYKLMTPDRRMRIASSMFDTARAIIESSLPLNLTRRERRLAFAKRLYAGELPDAALLAFAEWNGRHFLGASITTIWLAACLTERGPTLFVGDWPGISILSLRFRIGVFDSFVAPAGNCYEAFMVENSDGPAAVDDEFAFP
jgi:hypothetical protein